MTEVLEVIVMGALHFESLNVRSIYSILVLTNESLSAHIEKSLVVVCTTPCVFHCGQQLVGRRIQECDSF